MWSLVTEFQTKCMATKAYHNGGGGGDTVIFLTGSTFIEIEQIGGAEVESGPSGADGDDWSYGSYRSYRSYWSTPYRL